MQLRVSYFLSSSQHFAPEILRALAYKSLTRGLSMRTAVVMLLGYRPITCRRSRPGTDHAVQYRCVRSKRCAAVDDARCVQRL